MRGPYRTVYYRRKGSNPGDSDSDDSGSGGISLPRPINTKPTAYLPRTISTNPTARPPRHVSAAFAYKSVQFNTQRSNSCGLKQSKVKKMVDIEKRMRHKQYIK